MKKNYIAPALEEFKMACVTPLAASDPKFGGGGGGGADAPIVPDFDDEEIDFSDVKLW